MAGFTERLYSNSIILARRVKVLISFPKNVLRINQVISKPSYYPEMQRKTRGEMWKDNFQWLCKYHELNTFYTSYGLDIKDFRSSNNFLAHSEFCILRDKGNQEKKMTITGNYNYIVVLRDKYMFSAYLASTIGKKFVVKTQALICSGQAFLCPENRWCNVLEILTEEREMVIKKIDGECADGVMLVKVLQNQVQVNDENLTHNQFIEELGDSKYIVQEVVKQHSALTIFKTRSINTVRIVTIKGKNEAVAVFSAFLRIGGSSDSFVDNRAKGGLGIGVDLDTGHLMQYGYPHDAFGVKVDVHPNSGVRFSDVHLPYWREIVELVCNAHKQFYELQSIGWDVILTEHGPVLLEGNDDWEIGGPQDTCGGLRDRWNELVNR